MDANDIPCPDKDLAEAKAEIAKVAEERKMKPEELMAQSGITEKDLRNKVRANRLQQDTISEDKVSAFIQNHPDCFNGTSVQARHILVRCEPMASTAEQKAALAKLEKIATEIKDGKISFEEAAKTHSDCPSGKRSGGDLGEFTFDKMVPPFALVALSMKPGETSDIVRTPFGFHIIEVLKRTEGKAEPDPDTENKAKNALLSELQNKIFTQTLTTTPITIYAQ
jgi:parvulin-like peptidyl-prolyl isomerase